MLWILASQQAKCLSRTFRRRAESIFFNFDSSDFGKSQGKKRSLPPVALHLILSGALKPDLCGKLGFHSLEVPRSTNWCSWKVSHTSTLKVTIQSQGLSNTGWEEGKLRLLDKGEEGRKTKAISGDITPASNPNAAIKWKVKLENS